MIYKFANCYNHCQKENVPSRQGIAGLTVWVGWFFHLKLTSRMYVEHGELGQQQNIHILTFFYFSFDFFCRFHYTNIIQVHFKENLFYTPNVPKWPKLGKRGTPNIFLKLKPSWRDKHKAYRVRNFAQIQEDVCLLNGVKVAPWMWKYPIWR